MNKDTVEFMKYFIIKQMDISEKLIEEKFVQIHRILSDHENRIRENTKFVYTAMTAFTVIFCLLDLVIRIKLKK